MAEEEHSSSLCQKRWKLLASAIRKKKQHGIENKDNASIIRFPSYKLFVIKSSNDDSENRWKIVTANGYPRISLKICTIPENFSAEKLIGFNNTGNVCVWPAEECLARYCLENSNLFLGKRVVEVGGGMTSLAGLAIAQYCQAKSVCLTDGNEMSVKNLGKIINENSGNLTTTSITTRLVRWDESHTWTDLHHQFDAIICADCLFFDQYRRSLIECFNHLLDRSQHSQIFVVAPKRGNTFSDFVQIATQTYFKVIKFTEQYSPSVTKEKSQLAKLKQFDCNTQYPIFLQLARKANTNTILSDRLPSKI